MYRMKKCSKNVFVQLVSVITDTEYTDMANGVLNTCNH